MKEGDRPHRSKGALAQLAQLAIAPGAEEDVVRVDLPRLLQHRLLHILRPADITSLSGQNPPLLEKTLNYAATILNLG